MKAYLLLIASAILPAASWADSSDIKLTTGIEAHWSLGQIVKSGLAREAKMENYYKYSDWLDRRVFGFAGTIFSAQAIIKQRAKIAVGYSASVTYKPDESDADPVVDTRRSGGGGLQSAYGLIAFDDIIQNARTRLTIGFFPYNYAPRTQAFGAYLFKAGTYPGYVYSGTGESRLTGAHFETTLPASVRHGLFVTSQLATSDISLSYIVSYGSPALSIAGGVMLDKLIEARKRLSSPDSAKSPDAFSRRGYVDSGDTVWYSMAGAKLMARASIDFKHVFSLSKKLGKNDLKLYAEAAVLGIKNYPGYYDDITERIPVMAGINLPAFNLLDLCAVEVEYYGSPWKNVPSSDYVAVPYERFEYIADKRGWKMRYPGDSPGKQGITDNIKWAVVAEKNIRRLTIRAKAASDHFGYPDIYGQQDGSEHFFAPDQWYWQVELIGKL